MTFLLADRVQVTATANTTVSFTLSGAMTSYQSFAAIGNGNTTYYGATDGTNWETGIGTYSTTGPTLTRTTILSSSSSGSAVTFSGTVTVWVDYPASKAVIVNDVGDVLVNQSYDQGTGVLQVTGNSSFNGVVVDKSLNLQGGNNLVTQSQTFSTWALQNATISVAATTAPDGTNTVVLIYPASSGTYREIYLSAVIGLVQRTYSIYFKAQNKTWGFIDTSDNASSVAYFNLSSGVVGTVNSGITSASIIPVGNNWYRCSIVATTSSPYMQFGACDADASTSVTASGTNGVYIWGAQIELGTVASAYTPTTTAAITTTNNISVPSGSVTIAGGNLNIQRPIATTQVAPTIASSGTIAPTTYITFISGVTTINTITVPSPLSTYGGQLVLIPTGLFTTGIAGNIAVATTAVVSRALTMTYDTTTAKWYPSY